MRRLGAALLAAGLLAGCGGTFPSSGPAAPQPAAASGGLPAPAKLPPLERIDTDYEVLRDANVRAGPGTEYMVVTTVDAGRSVYVEGRVKGRNWFLVDTGDGGGYVHRSLLRAPEAAAEEPAAPETPAPAEAGGEDELPAATAPAGGEDVIPEPVAPVGGEDELPEPVGRGPAG